MPKVHHCPIGEESAPVPPQGRRPGRTSATRWPVARRTPDAPALRTAAFGVLGALALVLGYLESLFPLPVPVPGIKLGLGNIVVLYALVALGPGPAAYLALVKVSASALLFGTPSTLMFSAAGAALSWAVMALALRLRGLSVLGVSMLGGVAHMLGQLAMVAVVFTADVALFYLPVLVVAGMVSGAAVGVLCRMVMRATRGSAILRDRRRRLSGR